VIKIVFLLHSIITSTSTAPAHWPVHDSSSKFDTSKCRIAAASLAQCEWEDHRRRSLTPDIFPGAVPRQCPMGRHRLPRGRCAANFRSLGVHRATWVEGRPAPPRSLDCTPDIPDPSSGRTGPQRPVDDCSSVPACPGTCDSPHPDP
jgi:hypothetical protein